MAYPEEHLSEAPALQSLLKVKQSQHSFHFLVVARREGLEGVVRTPKCRR